MLLARGADPLIADQQGQTVLHRLALKGHMGVLRRLAATATTVTDGSASSSSSSGYLSRRLLDARDKQGNTALHYACEEGNGELARLLIEDHGCSVRAENNRKQTPVDLCAPQLRRFLSRYFD